MSLIEREKERGRYNKFNTQTVKCKICGEPTTMHGTQLCDSCWELKTRIERDFTLSLKIINLILKKKIREGTKL